MIVLKNWGLKMQLYRKIMAPRNYITENDWLIILHEIAAEHMRPIFYIYFLIVVCDKDVSLLN